MTPAPSYPVEPGRSVGPFKLGDTLWATLEFLRTSKTQYPKVDVSWDTSAPQTSAVVIHLPHITLYFPSPTQRLGRILLPNLAQPGSGLTLTYETHVLHAPSQPLTRGTVGRILGPTYDAKSGGKLVYPGISFALRPSAGGVGSGREDLVESVVVEPREGAYVPLAGIEKCVIMPGRGITLHLPRPLEIILGHTSSQDLLLDLGPPIRKFYKEDNRMARMWGQGESAGESSSTGLRAGTDCFWNYFQYGLDFLISPDGLVVKIIAYSNIPGTPLFQRYAGCPWLISTSAGDLTLASAISAFHLALGTETPTNSGEPGSVPSTDSPTAPPPSSEHLAVPAPVSGGGKKNKKRTGSNSSAQSDTSAKSDTSGIKSPGVGGTGHAEASGGGGGGMILDRIGEGGMEGVKGEMMSRLVGFEGLVVEEDLASGGICSVLVYKPEPG